MLRPIALLSAAVLAGCTIRLGERLDRYPPAQTPAGVRVNVTVRQVGAVAGELLAASDTALVLLTHDNRLTVVPLQAVGAVAYDSRKWTPGREPDALRPPARLRWLSRYPQGLGPDVLRRLLEALGQDAPLVVGRPAGAAARPHEPARAAGDDAADRAAVERFLESARHTTARYADRTVAIADGYRRLGPEFPAMGEHWIHPGLMVSGIVDASRPQVLCYATIDGVPTLVSLAFAVPLAPDEMPPAEPIGRAVWHDHAERVDEEVLLLAHPVSHRDVVAGFRLAMFHVWTGIDNPEGVFAQNNWRLPFLKLGIATLEAPPDAAAAQALALLSAAEDYYLRLFEAAASLGSNETAAVAAILAEHRARVARWAEGLAADEAASRTARTRDLAELEAVWTSLWLEVRRAVGERTWNALSVLHAAHHSMPGGSY